MKTLKMDKLPKKVNKIVTSLFHQAPVLIPYNNLLKRILSMSVFTYLLVTSKKLSNFLKSN